MNYIGIDLGTTNSAICSFDGVSVRLYKSPEQNDVTPSAIFIDPRGNKYVGARAVRNALLNPDAGAKEFKRMMGTNTPIRLNAVGLCLTPEECSSEVLRALFGYLPEEVRNGGVAGTVVTVPAAFNQLKKEATIAAADAAGLGRVALMQEPVAAVMSIMRQRPSDGIFVVYDLGGGTLDVAVAESVSGRVSLLAHGGIEMCGGRDFDRSLFRAVVEPWLSEKFDLPDGWTTNPDYKTLERLATAAAEMAKIELSQRQESIIRLEEAELRCRDRAGTEIYLNVPFVRKKFDELIGPWVDDSVKSVRETLEKSGIAPGDVDRVVFIGGPTQYKPLRDRVASELGIIGAVDVNPMSAVAEGAAVFAESIDWSSESRGRKSARGAIAAGKTINVSFDYVARTPGVTASIVARVPDGAPSGAEFQVDSLDSGWSSGRVEVREGARVDLNLNRLGDNTFKVFLFNRAGTVVAVPQDRIVIVRTAASIDAIPASHSIGLEVLDNAGERPMLETIVSEGDRLPKFGKLQVKAGESLKAGSPGSLRFRLWEGGICDPISDNRFIGMMEIKGTEFEDGVIARGADLECEYEVRDSGQILLRVSVPSIRSSFVSRNNLYSTREGKLDFTAQARNIKEQSDAVMARVEALAERVDDARVEQARAKLEKASSIRAEETDPETAKEALEQVVEAKRLLAQARREHRKLVRQFDLDGLKEFFEDGVRRYARPTEVSAYENLIRTAQRAVENNSNDFEGRLDDMRRRNFRILWRQDWFVIERFKWLASRGYMVDDRSGYEKAVLAGSKALEAGEMDDLRGIVAQLHSMHPDISDEGDIIASANILRG
ncbi:MAG: Hsp70 family protein [Alphaproteobacteria bacterium]|nr:Hsp70 family protein [Alphaproteobacteria bacterium]